MDKDEQIQEQVERYLDGLMTEAEIAVFEQQLQGSETLREALEEERMVRDAMQRLREQELRAKMKQWRQNAPEPTPSPEIATKKWFGWRFWLALVAAGLLGLWAYRHFVSEQKPEKKIEETKFLPDSSKIEVVLDSFVVKEEPVRSTAPPKKSSNPLLQRLASIQALINSDLGYIKSPPLAQRKITTDNPDSLSLETLASAALENHNFEKALHHIEQLDASKPRVRNMKAQALFGARQYVKAAEEFRALVNSSQYGLDARWNILMCYFAQYPDGQEDYRRELEQMLHGSSNQLRKRAEAWQAEVLRRMPLPSK